MTENVEDRYLKEGDMVTLKQELPNKPVMMVDKIIRATLKQGTGTSLLGIKTIWFDITGALHEHRFSTKDLQKVRK